jgi:hypothetical protein
MVVRAPGFRRAFLPVLSLALAACAGPRPASTEPAAPPALSATAADPAPPPPPPAALAAPSSSAPASLPPAPVASAPSAGPGAAPRCGAFASGLTAASAGALALSYYERTLRRLVRDWGRNAWQGPQAATARLCLFDLPSLGLWRHDDSLDGKADVILWGADGSGGSEDGARRLGWEPGAAGGAEGRGRRQGGEAREGGRARSPGGAR